MSRTYEPILAGNGKTDYARYMCTDALLSLQKQPEEMVHRDELLFQTVHQSTELWLKLAVFEAAEAARLIRAHDCEAAARLLGRATLAIRLVTDQLEMLTQLTPWTFQTIRTVLGHGSGFESPGWHGVQLAGQELAGALADWMAAGEVDLVALYQGSPDPSSYRLAEALVAWDERVAMWRVRHYKIATRIIGHGVVGTKGTPVDTLTRLISQKFFPELWEVRTRLSLLGPMKDAP